MDRKIVKKHKRLNSMRNYNYHARASNAKEFSEKAEVENLFLECIDEYKKDISSKRSTKLAFQAGLTNN